MDMEWAKDGKTGDLYIVQARPETVQSTRRATSITTYRLKAKGKLLASGAATGKGIAAGQVCLIRDAAQIAGSGTDRS
jgi:pyruvate,water dikinase